MEPHTESELVINDFVKDGPFTILSDRFDDISYITYRGEYVAQVTDFAAYCEKQSRRGLQFISGESSEFLETFHFFQPSPCAIPRHLLIIHGLFSSYDFKKKTISYYRNFEERETQRLAFIVIRNYSHEILDCKDPRPNGAEITYIQNHGLEILLSYNIVQRTTFLYQLVYYKKRAAVLEFLNQLEMSSKREYPFLFPEVFCDGHMDTAFDRAFDIP